jgi:hypothetical protein
MVAVEKVARQVVLRAGRKGGKALCNLPVCCLLFRCCP